MVNWQITATTIYCNAVDDEVTLIVYKDGTAKCTGYRKYGEPGRDISNLLRAKSKQSKRPVECDGLNCNRALQYKDKLFAEEAKKGSLESTSGEVIVPPQGAGN